MPKPSPKKPDIEFAPDAWERFESLVKSAAKMGPRPHDGNSAQGQGCGQEEGKSQEAVLGSKRTWAG